MTDFERRKMALEIALRLPDHRADATAVVDYLVAIVNAYLWVPLVDPDPQLQPPQPPRVRRVNFGGEQ
jgi:hypothetical protein